MTKVHTYPTDDLIVEYDAARCIHVKECVKGLPTVFDPDRRPWVDPSLASPEAVEDVIRRCPTGAPPLSTKDRRVRNASTDKRGANGCRWAPVHPRAPRDSNCGR